MLLLKQIAARLPNRWQNELKRIHFGRQISKGTFATDEPEYKILPQFITLGDWVIDIGANVGHYTKRFSELVGPTGRVIAFEPVPTTFSLLATNVQLFEYANVTLMNAAVSDKLDIVGMSIPKFATGLTNYYQASISDDADNALSVLTIALDPLRINKRIALIKIDAEGHESFVLAGIQELIKKYHPILIVETGSKDVIANLASIGYVSEKLQNSPNVLFKPNA
jgi:FkbM family methyltransferase